MSKSEAMGTGSKVILGGLAAVVFGAWMLGKSGGSGAEQVPAAQVVSVNLASTVQISRGMTRSAIEAQIGAPAEQCFTSFQWAQAGYQGVKTCLYGVTDRYGQTEDSMSSSWLCDAALAVDYDGDKVLDFRRPVRALRVAVSK